MFFLQSLCVRRLYYNITAKPEKLGCFGAQRNAVHVFPDADFRGLSLIVALRAKKIRVYPSSSAVKSFSMRLALRTGIILDTPSSTGDN